MNYVYTHPQCRTATGIRKPLANPAITEMIAERLKAQRGKAQMMAMRRAIQLWIRAMLTRSTWT